MRISHLLLHNITSQSNDNASQNESKSNFQWHKRWTVYSLSQKIVWWGRVTLITWVATVTAYLNFRWFTDTFS